MVAKLLMIDDQRGMTALVGRVAQQLGLEFFAVNNARDATDAFLNFRPDIVILDMVMPEKDGIDVLHEILLTGIPAKIVLTSGHSQAYLKLAEGVARFHNAESYAVLKKPFRRAQVADLLNGLCDNAAPRCA